MGERSQGLESEVLMRKDEPTMLSADFGRLNPDSAYEQSCNLKFCQRNENSADLRGDQTCISEELLTETKGRSTTFRDTANQALKPIHQLRIR